MKGSLRGCLYLCTWLHERLVSPILVKAVSVQRLPDLLMAADVLLETVLGAPRNGHLACFQHEAHEELLASASELPALLATKENISGAFTLQGDAVGASVSLQTPPYSAPTNNSLKADVVSNVMEMLGTLYHCICDLSESGEASSGIIISDVPCLSWELIAIVLCRFYATIAAALYGSTSELNVAYDPLGRLFDLMARIVRSVSRKNKSHPRCLENWDALFGSLTTISHCVQDLPYHRPVPSFTSDLLIILETIRDNTVEASTKNIVDAGDDSDRQSNLIIKPIAEDDDFMESVGNSSQTVPLYKSTPNSFGRTEAYLRLLPDELSLFVSVIHLYLLNSESKEDGALSVLDLLQSRNSKKNKKLLFSTAASVYLDVASYLSTRLPHTCVLTIATAGMFESELGFLGDLQLYLL